MTPLTLSEASSELESLLPAGKEAEHLNLVCEKLLARGKYRGFTARARFVVREDRQITLPMDFETMIGATLEDEPQILRDPWYEFVPRGSTPYHKGDFLLSRDLGDGFVTFRDPASPTALRLSAASEEEVEFTIAGRRTGDEGADSETFSLTSDFTGPAVATISGVVHEVTSFKKARTAGRVFLEAQQEDSSWLRVGCFEPRDEKISLRRYALPTAREGDVVVALCKRRFRKAVGDSDPLAVDSIYALRTALEALSLESGGDVDAAAKYWSVAVKHLDDALSEHRGSLGRTLPVVARGTGGTRLRAIR